MPLARSSSRVASTLTGPAFRASSAALPLFCQRCSSPSHLATEPPMPYLTLGSLWLTEELT